eukprot:Gregarina_sp_Pseudo_9__4660@NODE_484_length_2725_cov_21_191363_g456_i0_p1_GENE_NODE_484_length_2725_cov_21_191363_g456_i0NODE_484_length_2725_cov_21_191363_g456_i0_p1_ORF_typecomplete_len259_score54_75PIGH/PF10181_9/1_7e12bVLRF1/PF18826_1/0_36_NODE_484_length_2725_cov_21_191363_g456_i019492659
MSATPAFRMIEAWGSPESCFFKYSRVEKPYSQHVLRWSVPWELGLLTLHLSTRLLNLLFSPRIVGEVAWLLRSQEGVARLQYWSFLCLLSALAVHCLALSIVANTVEEEALLAVRSMGLQLSRSYCSGREQSLFIDVGRIQDILVNEAFSGHRVVSRLLVAGARSVGGKEDSKPIIHVPFDAARPRMQEIVYCWKFLRAVLFLESHHTPIPPPSSVSAPFVSPSDGARIRPSSPPQ